ncbi:RluA family pseudouridine synthase [Butyrivibrio sp. YAB3001]|uniref:RluA family pseudouridine synthase n=1 Tax=Butyrivibrio sp. YAB3001 TaxID=1520812 RepID=UPI0008F62F0B|nr:RluA family pseudouridine synthase [Butyrivibrio sp. YAB3001]SFC84259.1 23S rRNA pseudouridine1911/1915/1917 synthase [Butyrivibrio sp. YAB3001]
MKEIKYIYEDEDILVCHKPAGIATEGARAYNMDVVSAARNYLSRKNKDKKATGKPAYVVTVHRLDQPVEGVLILAKTKKAATDISAQIKNRTTQKYYYALCHGVIEENEGCLENYLARTEDGLARVVSEEEKNNCKDNCITGDNGEKIRIIAGDIKKAKLNYEVVARGEEETLLRIKLITGRFHQIRVQLANIGHPILGDNKYPTEASKAYSEARGINSVCLVSYRFELKHPSTKKRMEFEIVPDNTFIRRYLEV